MIGPAAYQLAAANPYRVWVTNVAGHPVDARRLARVAAQAAAALGLEVYGGDAIVTADALVLLDLNAWPSFARVREEASRVIADHLVGRVERGGR